MGKKKLLISAAVLLLLGMILAAFWIAFDWPPPRLILKYGLPPAGGPTGRRLTVEGIQFIELQPGYFQTEASQQWTKPSLLDEIGVKLGLSSEEPYWSEPRWTDGDYVEVANGFWISKTEVTRSQCYGASRRSTGSPPPSPDSLPIVAVSGNAAQRKIWEMSLGLGLLVRLPTLDEWEYACRAGGDPATSPARNANRLGEYAWFDGNTHVTVHPLGGLRRRSMPVALKMANAWGLHDTLGNVEEWCTESPGSSAEFALCGGSCSSDVGRCSPAWRNETPGGPLSVLAGIRLVLQTSDDW